MNILVVSDEVSRFLYHSRVQDHLAEVDLILSCGDLPYGYLEFLVSVLNVPLYYVFGNHDEAQFMDNGLELRAPRGGGNLDGRIVEVTRPDGGTLLIGGLEGSMRYNGRTHEYTESQMRRKLWRMTPRLFWNRWTRGRAIDILITHAPPAGIHDADDRTHQGFQTFRTFIDRHRPRYLIHGHTHERYRFGTATERVGATEIINVTGYCVMEVDLEHGQTDRVPQGATDRVLSRHSVQDQAGTDTAPVLRSGQGTPRHRLADLRRTPRD